jgi:hypothetical protein
MTLTRSWSGKRASCVASERESHDRLFRSRELLPHSGVDKGTVDGKEVTQTYDYSNFQKLPEGITMPMTMNNGFGDFVIKKVEINIAVPDSLFREL